MEQLRVVGAALQSLGVVTFRLGEVLGQVGDHPEPVVSSPVRGVDPQDFLKVIASVRQPRGVLGMFGERLIAALDELGGTRRAGLSRRLPRSGGGQLAVLFERLRQCGFDVVVGLLVARGKGLEGLTARAAQGNAAA